MRFRWLGVALAFALAPVLAACGSSDSSSATTASNASQPGKGKPADHDGREELHGAVHPR